MHICPPMGSLGPGTPKWSCRRQLLALAALFLLVQHACLFHKKKAAVPEAAPAAPTRIVLLPFNIPAGNTDLRWVSIAAPVLLAKTMEAAQDLEVVPIWQELPIAVEAVGQSREVTPEIAAYVASRLAAKWATDAQLVPTKDGVTLTLDFIPAKATMIAFRYQKDLRVDALSGHFNQAVSQFLDYLVARPLGKSDSPLPDSSSLKQLAEALDQEYGWFANANPGKAEGVVTSLIRTDAHLARLLFNPGLYPSLGSAVPQPRPIEIKPTPPPPDAKPAPEKSQPPSVQAAPTASPPESAPDASSAITPPSPTASPPSEEVAERTAEAVAPTRQTREAYSFEKEPTPQNYRTLVMATESRDPSPVTLTQTPQISAEQGRPGPATGAVGGYTVQVSAARTRAEVEAIAKRLEKEGLAAETEEVNLKEKGTWYRVRLTGYESRRAAKQAAERLVAAGLIKQYWIP